MEQNYKIKIEQMNALRARRKNKKNTRADVFIMLRFGGLVLFTQTIFAV